MIAAFSFDSEEAVFNCFKIFPSNEEWGSKVSVDGRSPAIQWHFPQVVIFDRYAVVIYDDPVEPLGGWEKFDDIFLSPEISLDCLYSVGAIFKKRLERFGIGVVMSFYLGSLLYSRMEYYY